MLWKVVEGGWRPALGGCGNDQEQFLDQLQTALTTASTEPFEIEKKLPFSARVFAQSAREAQGKASLRDRRLADFIAAYGCEVLTDDKDVFQDTQLRMVRSGDSAGQGLPFYALQIRRATDRHALKRALFEVWDYQDDGFSLRWDPIEDQRYALRWDDPSKPKSKGGLRTMLGANSLALEALPLLPTMPQEQRLCTTGFRGSTNLDTFFTWPIWEAPATLDSIRSLLALRELQQDELPRTKLKARGIAEVFRCRRLAQNKYYRNFSTAWSV